MVNVLCIYSAFLTIVDHWKRFYTTGFCIPPSHAHSYMAGIGLLIGFHLLIRCRTSAIHTHSYTDDAAPGATWGSVSVSYSRKIQHLNCRVWDQTRNLPITIWATAAPDVNIVLAGQMRKSTDCMNSKKNSCKNTSHSAHGKAFYK